MQQQRWRLAGSSETVEFTIKAKAAKNKKVPQPISSIKIENTASAIAPMANSMPVATGAAIGLVPSVNTSPTRTQKPPMKLKATMHASVDTSDKATLRVWSATARPHNEMAIR